MGEMPEWLLRVAVQRMPAEHRDWGAAMLAELASLQDPSERLRFALSCVRAVMFTPRNFGALLYMRDHIMKNLASSLVVSALIGLSLVLPFAVLDFTYNPSSRRNVVDQIVLLGLLWFLAAAFTGILVSLVRTWRAGGKLMANPYNLFFRIVFLALIAVMWGGIISDQLPCFLGVPNCD